MKFRSVKPEEGEGTQQSPAERNPSLTTRSARKVVCPEEGVTAVALNGEQGGGRGRAGSKAHQGSWNLKGNSRCGLNAKFWKWCRKSNVGRTREKEGSPGILRRYTGRVSSNTRQREEQRHR